MTEFLVFLFKFTWVKHGSFVIDNFYTRQQGSCRRLFLSSVEAFKVAKDYSWQKPSGGDLRVNKSIKTGEC